jgi:hypothetical protein
MPTRSGGLPPPDIRADHGTYFRFADITRNIPRHLGLANGTGVYLSPEHANRPP